MLPLEEYYFLLHAFDRLGRHLFEEWSGDELAQRPTCPLRFIAATRDPLDKHIADIHARWDELDGENRRILDGDKIEKNSVAMAALLEERNALQQRLLSFPQVNDDYRRDRGAFERQRIAKTLLLGALQSGVIRAQFGTGLIIDWATWEHYPGFRCSLELSLVMAPRVLSQQRRGTALIRRVEFDAWLSKTFPKTEPVAPEESLTPVDRCEGWLLKLTRDSDGKRPGTRDAILARAREAISGLTERQFLVAWSRVAPEDWKKSGRRPRS
jgi:hypothetical protein